MAIRAVPRLRLLATPLVVLLAGVGACQAGEAQRPAATATTTDTTTDAPTDAAAEPPPARNVIVVVGDGLGAAHRELVRLTTVGQDGLLAMDSLAHQGWTRTEPADPERAVTDSAAAATALATGVRTTNGSVGVDSDGDRLTTLLERAEAAGKSTGLVTTSRVTDATPAAFAAHVPDRGEHSEIARQYLEEAGVDVILGGGEDRWYPPGEEGAWPDLPGEEAVSAGRAGSLVERAQQLGYEYVSDAEELAMADGDRLLGLFANAAMFEHDEDMQARYEPSVPLPVMTDKAIATLSQDPDGFFLVVEEEGTDGFSHRNHAELMVRAGRALDEAVALARGFAAEDGETLLLVVADHETGGLVVTGSDRGETDENGPFPIVGTELFVAARWSTGGHTAAPVPASAEGPGADELAGVRTNTDVHDLVLRAMSGADG